MKLLDKKLTNKINDMVNDIVATCSRILSTEAKVDESASYDSKDDAKNRLKLVLMHDRSQLSPAQITQMREELVDVISRYVEIDREALDLCLEAETNTIALVANIPVLRTKQEFLEEQEIIQVERELAQVESADFKQEFLDEQVQNLEASQEFAQQAQNFDTNLESAQNQPQNSDENNEVTAENSNFVQAQADEQELTNSMEENK